MTREINLGQEVVIVTKEEVKFTKVDNWLLTLDDGGCALASYTIGGKTFSVTLWDAQTTPTYDEVNESPILFETIQERITEIINQ